MAIDELREAVFEGSWEKAARVIDDAEEDTIGELSPYYIVECLTASMMGWPGQFELQQKIAVAIIDKVRQFGMSQLLNHADERGYTAAHWAAVHKQLNSSGEYDADAAFDTLVRAGADMNARADEEQYTPEEFGRVYADAMRPYVAPANDEPEARTSRSFKR